MCVGGGGWLDPGIRLDKRTMGSLWRGRGGTQTSNLRLFSRLSTTQALFASIYFCTFKISRNLNRRQALPSAVSVLAGQSWDSC